jgi:hypothetical protein
MKKTVLILLSFSLLIFGNLKAQETKQKTEDATEVKHKTRWNYARIYIGVQPGFEIYKSDSANATAALLTGLNVRHYFRNIPKTYADVDLCNMVVVMESNHYRGFNKISAGFGILSPRILNMQSSYNIEGHVIYARSITGSGDMIGVGYSVEAQSVPITADYMKLVNSPTRFVLIGIKVPIVGLKF